MSCVISYRCRYSVEGLLSTRPTLFSLFRHYCLFQVHKLRLIVKSNALHCIASFPSTSMALRKYLQRHNRLGSWSWRSPGGGRRSRPAREEQVSPGGAGQPRRSRSAQEEQASPGGEGQPRRRRSAQEGQSEGNGLWQGWPR